MRVHGVELAWVERRCLQLTDAPAGYSLRARILGELCGSCDLGLHEYGCSCPPSMPLLRSVIDLPGL